MTNPTAAILVIGDEILSGRTREANLGYLATALTRVGINLAEARIVPDDHQMIVSSLNALRDSYDSVFTSGGIGPTHDDITADAVAAAFEVGIAVREDARAMLEAGYGARGESLNESRLRMARIPDGASLIVTSASSAPGFTLGNVHVLAGVPSIFAAMVDAVVPGLKSGLPVLSRELRFDTGEGRIAQPLSELALQFPAVSLGSYPFFAEGVHGTNIVVRGTDAELIEHVYSRLERLRTELGAVPAQAPR